MSEYKPTIGLEIHAELHTKTKMFCDSPNNPDEKRPNVNICPICTAQPGTLPVINKAAVAHVLRVGVAVGGELADYSEFDRKNYFYPDLPKGYQISQYKYPLVSGGSLNGVELTRIHLEEDAASNSHQGDHSLIDYNRAGMPLMELVTEPVLHDSATAGAFARELQLLLRTLGASEANMEKGQMRLEANVSISKDDTLGTKVEVKNINSFKALEKAIEYEIKRQTKALNSGETIVQETRGWDDNKGESFSQRSKEEAHDYRYFPDPDLPKLKLSEIPEMTAEVIARDLPELPWQKRERYQSAFGIKAEDIESYVTDRELGEFFETVVAALANEPEKVKLASNYITSDLLGMRLKDPKPLPEAASFAKLIEMTAAGELSSRGAKDLLAILYSEGGDPAQIADKHGLIQRSDEGALKQMVEEVLAENPQVVEDYKAGNEKLMQFFIGQGMKKSQGSANPQILAKLFKEALTS